MDLLAVGGPGVSKRNCGGLPAHRRATLLLASALPLLHRCVEFLKSILGASVAGLHRQDVHKESPGLLVLATPQALLGAVVELADLLTVNTRI